MKIPDASHRSTLHFQKSINNGLEVLANTTNYVLQLDTEIDHKDIRLTVAQSYFGFSDYEKCLVEVQTLGKMVNDSVTDSDIETKLLLALKALTNELK